MAVAATADPGAAADATAIGLRRRRPSRSTRVRRSSAASAARRRSSPTASRCPTRASQRLAAVDIEDYFSTPATRKAAAHIRGRLRSPNANLPQGDEDLARLVAKLTVEASRLEATPAKLELEALQLDLHRLERHISQARLSGDTSGVGALAAERLRVHEAIRHRLT